jgi:sugar O-acyltransferase (sialic acid O-acetyltransferase NeuD family)
LAIFGAGAAGREIAWLAQQCWGENVPLVFVVDGSFARVPTIDGIPVIVFDEFASTRRTTGVVLAIGDPTLRARSADKCVAAGLSFVTLVHPRVEASRWVTADVGTVICAGSILTTNVVIGQHVYINVGCTVSHDVSLGDFSTLSPGVHVAGWVRIGKSVFVGTGATIKNGATNHPSSIGDGAVVGAGACVIANVAQNETVVGVPAKPQR